MFLLTCTTSHNSAKILGNMAIVEVIGNLVGGGKCNLNPFAAPGHLLGGLNRTGCDGCKMFRRQSQSVWSTGPHDSPGVLLYKNLIARLLVDSLDFSQVKYFVKSVDTSARCPRP